MRYSIVGEDWVPFHDARDEFGATLDDLLKLEKEGKITVRTLNNPHNDKHFIVYAVEDLEELFPRKAKVTNNTNQPFWR